jgi:hypothetical protein
MQEQNNTPTPKRRLKRGLGVKELLEKKYDCWQLPNEWKVHIGEVASCFSSIVWGMSGNGKTRYVLQMVKVLAAHGNILFDCLEEGDSLTMQKAFRESNMIDIAGKIVLIDREGYDDLVYRLSKKKSPNIIVINSVQHMRMTYDQWKWLRKRFRKKCFILISHAEGKEPSGSYAKEIKYDVDIKIHVSDYVAYPISRYGGNTPFVIWQERAIVKPQWKKYMQAQLPAKPGDQLEITEPQMKAV